MGENHSAPSRIMVAETRSKYVWATILLTLSLSVIAITVTTGATSSVTMPGGRSQVAATGANSFTYSGQWGGYGGPITPNGVAVDASGNVFIADAKKLRGIQTSKRWIVLDLLGIPREWARPLQ